MKKIISIFVLGLTAVFFASCASYVLQDSANTADSTSDRTNSVPPEASTLNVTQHFEFSATGTNPVPLELLTPESPLTLQLTNPIDLRLSTGAVQLNLSVTNTPLKFENTNFGVTVALTADSSVKDLLSGKFSVTSTQVYVGAFGNESHMVSPNQVNVPLSGWNLLWALGWLIALFIVGLIGRYLSYFFLRKQAKRLVTLYKDIILSDQTSSQVKPEDILAMDLIAGGFAGMLVPAFLRIFPGSSSVASIDTTSQIITMISLALLMGMLGVEFIRALCSLSLWLLVSAKKKRSEQQSEEQDQIEKEFPGSQGQIGNAIASTSGESKRTSKDPR